MHFMYKIVYTVYVVVLPFASTIEGCQPVLYNNFQSRKKHPRGADVSTCWGPQK